MPEIAIQIDLRFLHKVVFLIVLPFINYVLLIVTLYYICARHDVKEHKAGNEKQCEML